MATSTCGACHFRPLKSLHTTSLAARNDVPEMGQTLLCKVQRGKTGMTPLTKVEFSRNRLRAHFEIGATDQSLNSAGRRIVSQRFSSSKGLFGKSTLKGKSLGVDGLSRRKSQRPMGLFGLGSEAPPESIPLTPITTEEDLDAALQTAEEEGKALLIDW